MRGMSALVAGLLIAVFARDAEGAPFTRHFVPGSQSETAVTYQINPAHTGSIDFAAGFAPPLKQAWSKDIVYNINTSQPVIADGTVFATAGGFNFAIDLANGHERWMKSSLDGYLLAYDNGNLFSISYDGFLSSFALDTGKKKWSVELPDEYAFNAPPMAVNGQVFVAGTGTGGRLYAVDEATGAVQWEKPVDNGDFSTPAYGDNGIYVTYPCRYYKFDPASGDLIWEKHGHDSGGGGATPVYFDKKLMVLDGFGCGYDSILTTKRGKKIGAFTTDHIPVVFTSKRGRRLAASSYLDSQGWALHCWDIKTGKELWRYAADNLISTDPIVVNGQLVVGSTLGKVSMVDETGKEIWTAQTPKAVTTLTAGLGTLIVVSTSIITAYVPN